MSPEAQIALGAAFLGAVIGGFASAVGTYFVARRQQRRDMRVRLYDEYIGDASGALARWWKHSQDNTLDTKHNDALFELARVRRAAVIASKADRRQVLAWEEHYQALIDLSLKIGRLQDDRQGKVAADERREVLAPVVEHAQAVIAGLHNYMQWLEKKIA